MGVTSRAVADDDARPEPRVGRKRGYGYDGDDACISSSQHVPDRRCVYCLPKIRLDVQVAQAVVPALIQW